MLGRGSNDYLWFTILSATNNYIYGRSSTLDYTTLAKEYKDEVDRLSPSQNTRATGPGGLRTEDDLGSTSQSGNVGSSSLGASQRKAETNAIRFIEDFQLVLLRHWNLYDSLYHSLYVGTKMGIWKEKGRQKLTNMLVRMGYDDHFLL